MRSDSINFRAYHKICLSFAVYLSNSRNVLSDCEINEIIYEILAIANLIPSDYEKKYEVNKIKDAYTSYLSLNNLEVTGKLNCENKPIRHECLNKIIVSRIEQIRNDTRKQ